MKKDNVRIKKNITLMDRVNAIEGIVSACFTGGKYTPYYRDMAETLAIIICFIDGLEFEENEAIYTSAISDPEVRNLIDLFKQPRMEVYENLEYVREYVDDILEFEKQRLIHSHADTDKIVEACNVIIDSLDNFSKLNVEQMSKEDMNVAMNVMKQLSEKNFTKEDLTEILKNASNFNMDEATKEIIDTKNTEIRELKKYKTLWESRNVTNENKIVEMPTKE